MLIALTVNGSLPSSVVDFTLTGRKAIVETDGVMARKRWRETTLGNEQIGRCFDPLLDNYGRSLRFD